MTDGRLVGWVEFLAILSALFSKDCHLHYSARRVLYCLANAHDFKVRQF